MQVMRQLNHPNLLPLYCSFVHGDQLWMVMPLIDCGSMQHIMRSVPEFEQVRGLLPLQPPPSLPLLLLLLPLPPPPPPLLQPLQPLLLLLGGAGRRRG